MSRKELRDLTVGKNPTKSYASPAGSGQLRHAPRLGLPPALASERFRLGAAACPAPAPFGSHSAIACVAKRAAERFSPARP